MKNTFGNAITVTIFGESHGEAVGAVIDGLAPGIEISDEYIADKMMKRAARGDISTKRQEADKVIFLSGVYNHRTTGTPLALIVENNLQKSSDYTDTEYIARPSHADYTARVKYHGFEDYRGGGHFSGRVTAALTAAGAVVSYALMKKGIIIGTHIKKLHGIFDREFDDIRDDIAFLSRADFPVLSESASELMKNEILFAQSALDSVGGVLETAVIGVDAGVGEPFFDSCESMISHILFSVPGIKGVEFGAGFDISDMMGSEANDGMYCCGGKVLTYTNNSGGIQGGISNGMPIILRCAVKPTPSIAQKQNSVSLSTLEEKELSIHGRHDPAIIHRARAVIDSAVAIAIADLLTVRYGTDFLATEEY